MGVFSWKKIKEGAKTLGQNAAKFAGKLNSLYKTFKPLINVPLDCFTGGVGPAALGGASALMDMFENRADLSETQRMDLVDQGLDLVKDGAEHLFNKLSTAPRVNVDQRSSAEINARRGQPILNEPPLRQLRG